MLPQNDAILLGSAGLLSGKVWITPDFMLLFPHLCLVSGWVNNFPIS